MNSSELQRQVKNALENLSAPVTKDYREFNGTYPHIVYHEISNVPALHGDNREFAFRTVFQVTIVTNDDDYEALETAVETAMINLGFIRTDTQDIIDEQQFNRVLRFTCLIQKS